VVKQPWLYLIGLGTDDFGSTLRYFTPSPDLSSGDHNLPGADFPFAAANTIYQTNGMPGITDEAWPFDLAGRADMAVFTRWQTLSRTQEGAAKMINLLWTDLAASAVVGTKGISTSPHTQVEEGEEGGGDPPPVIYVRPAVRKTRYHFAYGIPAFVLLAVLVALTAGSICASLARVSSLDKVRRRIHQLSAGRIFTIVLYPGESDFSMSSKQWSLMSGGKTVRFADGEHGVGGGMVGEEEEGRDGTASGERCVYAAGDHAKGEVVVDKGTIQVPEDGQHGGYIALGPVSPEGR
jgi:hypothetical protein